tara:strand:+ start:1150 stop:1374 length:225 start_codon:yes stop_codon:yes gene_type:complete
MSKITISKLNGEEEVRDMTSEEQAQYDADIVKFSSEKEAEENAKAEQDALKASAKTKLVAGEPLTEAEADTLIL